MTRTLILTRHAKSSWATPGLADHDRPLNQRGIRSARAIGQWLREGGWHPDQTLSSSSRRTRETYAGLGVESAVSFTNALYHASAGQMLAQLRVGHGGTVLMLGHNPGIAAFAAQLVATPPDHPRFFDYPTCATLIVQFEIESWEEVGFATGKAVDFIIPRTLLE